MKSPRSVFVLYFGFWKG